MKKSYYNMKSLFRNGIYNILYNLINVVFPLISSIYVARILSVGGIGKVAYAQNVVSYFVVVASLGLPSYGVRIIAENRDSKKKLSQSFSELFIINSVMTTISIFTYIFLVANIFSSNEQLRLQVCCGLLIVLNYINIDWFFKGIEEYGYIALRNAVVKVLSFVALLMLVKDKNDYIVYALIVSLGTGLNYFFNIIQIKKYVKFSFSKLQCRRHFIPLIILGISIFLSTIYNKVDITMMGSLSTNIEIGYYSYSHKIVLLVITICTSLTSVYLPRLSFLFQNELNKFYEVFSQGIKLILFIGIPACIGFFILTPQIIYCFYGQEFMPAAGMMRILAVMIIVRGVGDLLCYQLAVCTGNEKKQLPAYIVATCLNILLNFFLIPRFGGRGAAFASLISEITVNGYQILVLYRIIRYPIPGESILKSLFSAIIMGGSVWLIISLGLSEVYTLGISIVVGISVYLAMNVIICNEIVLSLCERIKSIYASFRSKGI